MVPQILPAVPKLSFFPVEEGIYFIPGKGVGQKSSLQFLSFATGKIKTVTLLSGPASEGLSVSQDGRSLLFSVNEGGSDLMLVENFR